MCEYSLLSVPNRLATNGEELITYRFSTGSLGLASPSEVVAAKATDAAKSGFRAFLKHLFTLGAIPTVRAVCVPPGSSLLIRDIPRPRQTLWNVAETELVLFTQIAASAGRFRDAITFRNGCQILFQELWEGQRVKVLNTSTEKLTASDAEAEMDPVGSQNRILAGFLANLRDRSMLKELSTCP
jgi:hypothetical protein